MKKRIIKWIRRDLPLLLVCASVWSTVLVLLAEAMIGQRSIANDMITLNVPKRMVIEDRVNRALEIEERRWNAATRDRLVTVLMAAEQLNYIEHDQLLAILMTESDLKIRTVSRNTNGSIDYGIAQQNSDYLEARYARARKILDELGIPYTHDRFDITVNVMSAAITVAEFRGELVARGVFDPDLHLVAYNVGPNGALMPSRAERRARYLERYRSFLGQL